MDASSFGHMFHQQFQVVPAHSENLRDTVYRIRYEVYCREFGFEDPGNFPDGRETDIFDQHSEHCLLLHKATTSHAGCVRLVLSDPSDPQRRLPFEAACGRGLNSNILELADKSRPTFGEISRLALCPSFRGAIEARRAPANVVVHESPSVCSPSLAPGYHPYPSLDGRHARRRAGASHGACAVGGGGLSHAAMGLYLAGAAMALDKGLRSVFAMMELRLARKLRHYGIHFQQVGDVVDYHGLRGPFQITRDGLFAELCPELRKLLENLRTELGMANPFRKTAS